MSKTSEVVANNTETFYESDDDSSSSLAPLYPMALEIVRHYKPREVSKDFMPRFSPGRVREFNNVEDAILNQHHFGTVLVVHGSNGFHPIPEQEKMRKNRLIMATPDSHTRFNGRYYPLAQKRRALFLDNVHLETSKGSFEYDLIYGNVPNMNLKFYNDQLQKFKPEQILDYYVTPLIANSFYKAYQENAEIVVFDGFYEKYRFPKDHTVRADYNRALDRVFDHWITQYLPYFKSIVVIGKN